MNVEPMSLDKRRRIVPCCGMSSLEPADRWEDALVTGNGKMGALVFGNPINERLVFNHERFNLPQWHNPPEPPDIAHIIPQVKELMLEGKYAEAYQLSIEAAKAKGWSELVWTDMYHPGYAMMIELQQDGGVSDYLRTVNFETGEVTVQWQDDLGDWLQRTFVSRADNVIVHSLTAPAGSKINATVWLDEKLHKLPEDIKFTHQTSPEWLALYGQYNPQTGKGGFGGTTRIITKNSSADVTENKLVINDTDELLLLTRLELCDNFIDKQELEQVSPDYDDLLEKHTAIHSKIFNRVTLDLGGGADTNLSSEEFLKLEKTETMNTAFLEKMFHMGRYVFLSSCGDWPPRLTGIWNASWNPSWRGDFTTDANVNLAVSGGNIGNMPEAMEAYFGLIEGIFEDWKINARKLFGCRGALAGPRTDGNHNLHNHFSEGFPGHFWVAGAEWLYQPFIEHYQITGDTDFLIKRVIPALKEIVFFFEDFLTETDSDGNVIFVPSYSPENAPSNTKCPAAINATMDIAVCKEALTALIEFCEKAGLETENIKQWGELLAKMPPYLVNSDGALKEWAWESLEDRYNHRHLSHLYPLWPGLEINPEETPKMFKAAQIAARMRGQGNGSAHGLMHMALVATRLKDDHIVYSNLKQILEENYVYRSMVTSHNPGVIYNVDASCSLPAVIMEMLVYSRPGVIELLPALSEKFAKGSIGGVCCRSQALVESLKWNYEAGIIQARLLSQIEQQTTLIVRRGIQVIEASPDIQIGMSSLGKSSREIVLPAGQSVDISITMSDIT